MMSFRLFLALPILLLLAAHVKGQVFKSISGTASFTSEAPLEIIEASSNKLVGAIDTKKNAFAFKINLVSFDGFNSPLQKTHFNENYMESQKYPTAYFTGKLIEQINFNQEGVYTVRAKGKLMIHGVKQERIIKVIIRIVKNEIYVESTFSVLLKEHKIRVPKIVHQKIAEEILVNIKSVLTYSKQ